MPTRTAMPFVPSPNIRLPGVGLPRLQTPGLPFLSQPQPPSATPQPTPGSTSTSTTTDMTQATPSWGKLLFPALGALAGGVIGGKFGAATGFGMGSGFLQGQKAEQDRLAELERQGLRQTEEDYQRTLNILVNAKDWEGAATLEESRGNKEGATAFRARKAEEDAATGRGVAAQTQTILNAAFDQAIEIGDSTLAPEVIKAFPGIESAFDNLKKGPVFQEARQKYLQTQDLKVKQAQAAILAEKAEADLHKAQAISVGKKETDPVVFRDSETGIFQRQSGSIEQDDRLISISEQALRLTKLRFELETSLGRPVTNDEVGNAYAASMRSILGLSPEEADISPTVLKAISQFVSKTITKSRQEFEAEVVASKLSEAGKARARKERDKLEAQAKSETGSGTGAPDKGPSVDPATEAFKRKVLSRRQGATVGTP